MKKILLICLLLLPCRFIKAQINLVPNPSFEDTISLWTLKDWTKAQCSPDYWNNYLGGPAKSEDFYLTAFTFGKAPHPPRTGHGMVGLTTGGACWPVPFHGPDMYKEIWIAPLKSPLQKGVKYYVSLYCLAIDSLKFYSMDSILQPSPGSGAFSFSNHLGVYFTNTLYDYNFNSPPNFNKSPVCAKNVISDTGNWVRISGAFIPDSNYNYIMIGNFYDGPHTTFFPPCKDLTNLGEDQATYYFIDDVFVSSDSTGFIFNGINNTLHENSNDYLFSNINNRITFDFKTDATINSGFLYDLYGNIIRCYSFQSKLEDNLDDLSQGIYLIQIIHDNTKITKKIIIEHKN